MLRFFLGFLSALIFISLVISCWMRLGMIDPRADMPMNSIERSMAMPALDASVDRRAPRLQNPIQPTDANLTAGMKVYQSNCATCHGDIRRPHSLLADSLYPRAPQFLEDAADMPEHQNFYIIQHGIRMSAMPGWRQVLSEQQMWQATTFLSHIDKLPAVVSDAWKTAADSSSANTNISPP
jgi:thiosulfate dehydrogenase